MFVVAELLSVLLLVASCAGHYLKYHWYGGFKPPRHPTSSVNDDDLNPLKRKKPYDTPDSSPTANGNSTTITRDEIDLKEDTQGRKYIEVLCGGRTGKLLLNKFHKLEGSKGYSKCIEYGGRLVAPQEFEAIGGMKATKSWKRSLKHKCKPLLILGP